MSGRLGDGVESAGGDTALPAFHVVMAVVGPVLLLMTIFLVLAANNQERDCDNRVIDPANLARDVRLWLDDEEERVRAQLEDLQQSCPNLALDAGPARAVLDPVVPEPVRGLCSIQRADVMKEPGVEQRLNQLARDRAAIADAERQCRGSYQDVCQQVGLWLDGEEERVRAQLKDVQQSCPDVALDALRTRAVLAPIVPEPVPRLCSIQREQRLNQLARDRAAIADAERQCRGSYQDVCQQVGLWLDGEEERVRAQLKDVQQSCPDLALDALRARALPAPIVPESVPGLCSIQRERHLNQLVRDRAAIADAERKCRVRHQGACRQVSPSELGLRADRVRAWRDRLEREDADLASSIPESCRTAAPPSQLSALAPDVMDLCPNERDDVLKAAKIPQSAIEELAGRVESRRLQLASCVKLTANRRSREVVGPRSDDLQYRVCRARTFVICPEGKETCTELSDHFLERATWVIQNLASGDYNRVDILGHTDDQAFKEGARCDDARNNEELSALRALRYRQLLIDAIDALARTSTDARAVQGQIERREIRVYAIAVGSAEPVVPNARTQQQFQANRRIEIRYVNDARSGQ